jgi:hypothetical protein
MSDVFFHCGECGEYYLNANSAVMCCAPEINPVGVAYPGATYVAAAQPPVPEPKAAELLGRAAKHMHDRAATYDKPEGERSMGRAVDAFNAVTGSTLKESEGWLFMALLKAVRSETRSEPHQDSLEDLIAYTALYAEARGEGR